MKSFATIVNGFQQSTIGAKFPILDVCQGSDYTSSTGVKTNTTIIYNLTVKSNVHDFGVIHKRKEDFLEKNILEHEYNRKCFFVVEIVLREKRSEDTTFTSATYHS